MAQIVGSHRVRIGVGWLEVAMSFGNLAGPVSAGALLDAFGGTEQGAGPYKPAIVSSNRWAGLNIAVSRWRDYCRVCNISRLDPLEYESQHLG